MFDLKTSIFCKVQISMFIYKINFINSLLNLWPPSASLCWWEGWYGAEWLASSSWSYRIHYPQLLTTLLIFTSCHQNFWHLLEIIILIKQIFRHMFYLHIFYKWEPGIRIDFDSLGVGKHTIWRYRLGWFRFCQVPWMNLESREMWQFQFK